MNSKYNFLIVSKDFYQYNPCDPNFIKCLEENGFTKVIDHDKDYRIFEHNTKDCSIYVMYPRYGLKYHIDNHFDGLTEFKGIPFSGFDGFITNSSRWYEFFKHQRGTILNTLYGVIVDPNGTMQRLMMKLKKLILLDITDKIYGYEYIDTDMGTKYYCEEDINLINEIYGILSSSLHQERKNTMNKYFEIEKVIFNDPATIIFWKDGTKTVTKCGEKDFYDPEKGLAMCLAKRALGDKGNYYETFKKWLPEENKSLVYTGHEKVKANIAENKYGDRYDTRLFFAGKKHKIVCAGDCYHVKNIKKQNSLVYYTLKDAIEDGCTPCKHCKGVHKCCE